MSTQQVIEPDKPEGIGDDADSSWSDYPIDTMLIRNESRTVHDVLRRIESDQFIMDPDFQRDFIWLEDKQSKLIESVLMRIPLPVFYLAENNDGRMIVVDGLQRLSTFQRFVNNELQLKLPNQSELHRKRFSELPPKLKNRIEDCNLILYMIDAKVPERARLDIFERVNSGVPLTRQQMRNCLYTGPATRFLKTEASTEIFKQATGGSLNADAMRDREFINRFCAFQLFPLDQYKGDMDDFLAKVLKKMNSLETEALNDLSLQLRNGLTNNYKVFGKHSFRKHTSIQKDRSVINASLWDVMSTGLSRYTQDLVEIAAEDLREKFYSLMDNDEFIASVTYSTNDVKRVRPRFMIANQMFQEVFGA